MVGRYNDLIKFSEFLSADRISDLGLEELANLDPNEVQKKVDGLGQKLLENATPLKGGRFNFRCTKKQAIAAVDFLDLFCLFAMQINGISKRNLHAWTSEAHKSYDNKTYTTYTLMDEFVQDTLKLILKFHTLLHSPHEQSQGGALKAILKPTFDTLSANLNTIFLKHLNSIEQVALGNYMQLATNNLKRYFKIK